MEPPADPPTLHPFIRERIRELYKGSGKVGEYVLYWMPTALRIHENPALDVARHEAKKRSIPLLLCAFVLTEGHPHPTLRRFKFVMEGLQDLQLAFMAQVLFVKNLPFPSPACTQMVCFPPRLSLLARLSLLTMLCYRRLAFDLAAKLGLLCFGLPLFLFSLQGYQQAFWLFAWMRVG